MGKIKFERSKTTKPSFKISKLLWEYYRQKIVNERIFFNKVALPFFNQLKVFVRYEKEIFSKWRVNIIKMFPYLDI